MSLTELFLKIGQSPADTLEFLKQLRHMVKQELRRRGVPHSVLPAYLGLEAEEWSDLRQKDFTDPSREGVLHPQPISEFTTEFYIWMMDSYTELRVAAELNGAIGGLIRTKIRHFIYDRQRKNDPIGSRAYTVAKRACEDLIDTSKMRCLDSSGGLSRDTPLAFDSSKARLDSHEVTEAVRRRSDCGEVATSIAKESKPRATARLGKSLVESKEELPHFLFGDYVKPWAQLARSANKSVFRADGSEVQVERTEDGQESLELVFHDSRFVIQEEVEQLKHCLQFLSVEVEASTIQNRVRVRLHEYLRLLPTLLDEDPIPSDADVARRLGVSTSTFAEDKARVREYLEKFYETQDKLGQ